MDINERLERIEKQQQDIMKIILDLIAMLEGSDGDVKQDKTEDEENKVYPTY